MKSILLVFLFPTAAFASNQIVTCYGINQTATLELEFGASSSAYVDINDEGTEYSAVLKKPVDNRDGTVTFVQTKNGPIRVTIPKVWLDRDFERFSKHEQNGHQISEMVQFEFGNNQSLIVSECESEVD